MSTNPHFNDEDDLVAGYTFNPDQHANERRGTHTHTHTHHVQQKIHTCSDWFWDFAIFCNTAKKMYKIKP